MPLEINLGTPKDPWPLSQPLSPRLPKCHILAEDKEHEFLYESDPNQVLVSAF